MWFLDQSLRETEVGEKEGEREGRREKIHDVYRRGSFLVETTCVYVHVDVPVVKNSPCKRGNTTTCIKMHMELLCVHCIILF